MIHFNYSRISKSDYQILRFEKLYSKIAEKEIYIARKVAVSHLKNVSLNYFCNIIVLI